MRIKSEQGWGVLNADHDYLWDEFFRTKKQANSEILDAFARSEILVDRKIFDLTQAERDSELKKIWRRYGLQAVRVELRVLEDTDDN